MGLGGTSSYASLSMAPRQVTNTAPAAPPNASLAPSYGPTGVSQPYNRPTTQGLGGSMASASQRAYGGNQHASQSFGLGGSVGASRYGGVGTNPQFNNGVANGGPAPAQNSVQQAQSQGPSLADIQAEMQRRQVGAQLNANPQNSALAGYMMG